MKKILAILLVAVTLLVGCSRVAETPTPMNLEAIAKTFFEASDSGDIERCLSLLSDDVAFSQDPPGVEMGKAQYEAALRETAKSHRKHSVTIPYKVDGDKVTFTAKVSGDDFSILGMDYINISYELQVRDEKITSIVATPDSADWAKLVRLSSGGGSGTGSSPSALSEQPDKATFQKHFSITPTPMGLGKILTSGNLPQELQQNVTVFAIGDQITLYGNIIKECQQPRYAIYDVLAKKVIKEGGLSFPPIKSGFDAVGFVSMDTLEAPIGKYEYKVYVSDVLVAVFPFEVR